MKDTVLQPLELHCVGAPSKVKFGGVLDGVLQPTWNIP